MGHSADLVVLGAGPAGLAAALRAAVRGLSVEVVERAPVVGGLAGSFDVAGIRVDHGSHRLHPATPERLLADLRGLLGDDLQQRPRHGRLRLGDRWVGFPLKAGELARTAPRSLLARVARDTAVAPLRRACHTDTYAGVLRTSLGPAMYGALYAPYAVKLWGLPGERIDSDQARKRVTADTPWKVARRVLSRTGGAGGQGRIFYYPRRGFGQIVESLADAALTAGAGIRLGTVAERVEITGAGTIVELAGGEQLAAGHVFSTIPLTALAGLARPEPPAPVRAAAQRLRFRAMILVYLVHEGGRWTEFDAHYLPGAETPVTRISEPANYRESADDPSDRTVLCFEIPCALDDPLWRATDTDLAGLARECAARAGLPPIRLAQSRVRRVPRVYPIYEVGYGMHLAGLDAWASARPDVTTFGRMGLFAHDNTHHAMEMGYDAADALGSGSFDRDMWSEARTRFAAHVVED